MKKNFDVTKPRYSELILPVFNEDSHSLIVFLLRIPRVSHTTKTMSIRDILSKTISVEEHTILLAGIEMRQSKVEL